jgi:hypothetical protein
MHILHSLMNSAWALFVLLALGFCLALGVVRYVSGRKRGRILMANTAATYSPTPYDPNGSTHKGGRVSRLLDATISLRWSLVTEGATPGVTVKANTASSTPIGTIDDTSDTFNGDTTIPANINLFAGVDRTQKVVTQSATNPGDWLIPDTTNPIYGMTDPGLNLNRFGKCVKGTPAGGGVAEFAPMEATRIAAGIYTSAVSATSDAIPVTGLLSTDFVVVTMNTQGSTETVKTAQAAAGQINLVLSVASTGGTTKYNYSVYRA